MLYEKRCRCCNIEHDDYPNLLKTHCHTSFLNILSTGCNKFIFKTFVSLRLSERNCIEIVNKLIAQKQLEVVHTLDGKEYITPAQISKEMRDELHVRGGK